MPKYLSKYQGLCRKSHYQVYISHSLTHSSQKTVYSGEYHLPKLIQEFEVLAVKKKNSLHKNSVLIPINEYLNVHLMLLQGSYLVKPTGKFFVK